MPSRMVQSNVLDQGGRKWLTVSQPARFRWYLLTTLWFLLLFIGVVGLIALSIQAATGPNDFCQDYWSAVAVLHGQAVYPPVYCWAGYMHLPVAVEYNSHPPTSILLYVPIGLLPKLPATMLWGFLSLAALHGAGRCRSVWSPQCRPYRCEYGPSACCFW